MNERKTVDDAKDIGFLVSRYDDLSRNSFYDEIGEENFPFGEPFDLDMAKFFLSGRSLGACLSTRSRKYIREILESWVSDEDPEIIRKWGLAPSVDDEEREQRRSFALLQAFLEGFIQS